MVLASVPCGWMGELLLFDYSVHRDVTLIGIDLDQAALDGALELARSRHLEQQLTLLKADAWATPVKGVADILTSNGLNIHEPDEERVLGLYRNFFDALKPGGRLVTSFLTPPPTLSSESPWNMGALSPELLALQRVLSAEILAARWNTFRTHTQTRDQLERAGFVDITFVDDSARMFPTVIANKPAD
jgi:SAM-dependent methyltransferase